MITVGDDAKPRGSNVAISLFCRNVVRHLLAEWRFSSVLAASKKALKYGEWQRYFIMAK